MKKNKITEMIKGTKGKIALGALGGVLVGSMLFGATSEQREAVEGLKESNSKVVKLEEENKELKEKVNEAKPWFDMKAEEKQKLEEESKKAEEAKKQKEEAEKKAQEAKQANKIGEKIVFEQGSKGEFALTIDKVSLTNERNQFADKVDNVVEINYTVENISMDELDFFMTNSAEFYDAEGIKCTSYPNSKGAGTYDIAKGKKAKGTEFIGVNGSKFLEMQIGDVTYKWDLN